LFAAGDEQRFALGSGGLTRQASAVTAPLDQSNVAVSRGEEVRIDVVVRSREVGHFFPSGTVDAHDVWLELQAIDDRRRTIFWSGAVTNDVVDSTAHFYRSYLVDDAGNHIDKNNTWAAREAVYVNLIPPGGVEVAHYRLKIPPDCGDQIHLTAKLNYRKFSWQQTQWTFAGSALPASHNFAMPAGAGLLAEILQNGSGAALSVPAVPIVEMARDAVTLVVTDSGATQPNFTLKAARRDAERWNRYGMGLLRQGDLKSAEAAFQRAAQLDSNRAETWVNVGIVRLREGKIESAKQAFEVALKMDPVPFKVYFYYGLTFKALGRYDEALKYLRRTVAKFPRDCVARNERGHLFLLMKDYPRAIADFEKVLSIDPENVEAYYYLKNAYRSAGDAEKAEKAGRLYERFKASESSLSRYDLAKNSPHVWRERQPIHEH
jgi:tetratricopeptide (TPR) repeat protein